MTAHRRRDPVPPHSDDARPAPVRDPERRARALALADIPDDDLAAQHAAVARRMAEACVRVRGHADELRDVLAMVGVIGDGGTRTSPWGVRLGPAAAPSTDDAETELAEGVDQKPYPDERKATA